MWILEEAGYTWLKIITLQEDFPGSLRNISTEGDNLGEGSFSRISRCEAEPRKQGWAFPGPPQGTDTPTPVKIFHRSFLHCAIPGALRLIPAPAFYFRAAEHAVQGSGAPRIEQGLSPARGETLPGG